MSSSPRRPNISAVADRAGVARSTVSRVLNGGQVSADTKQRVQRAMAELHYSPSLAAQNFANGRSGAIGVVLEDIRGEWLTDLLGGIETELHEARWTLLLGSLGTGEAHNTSVVSEWIQGGRVDGLVFIHPGLREENLIQQALQQGLALSLVAPDTTMNAPHVVQSSNREAGRELGRHLATLGHSRIAYVGGPKAADDARERLLGLEEALAEFALDLEPANIHFCDRYHRDEGRAFAAKWLRTEERPTALVFGNDAMALGFMNVALSRGVAIPDEVTVVGFDDIGASSLVWPRLTTVRQDGVALGAAAIRAVSRQLARSATEPWVPTEDIISMSLIVRESSARCPAANPKT